MDRVSLVGNMTTPAEAVRVARICHREAALYERSPSRRCRRVSEIWKSDRTFFLMAARYMKNGGKWEPKVTKLFRAL